jgi:hypothetical protein
MKAISRISDTLGASGRASAAFLTAPKNRYLLSDRSRGEAKILDSCSISQIHLCSKSQISNLQSIDTHKLGIGNLV